MKETMMGFSMMRMGRYRHQLVIGTGMVIALLLLAGALCARLDLWRMRGELRLAQQEMASGRLEAARRRLTALAARPGTLDGAADYWLGICSAIGGDPDAAHRAFARVPVTYAYDPNGAYLEAKANLSLGRLRAAEDRLVKTLSHAGSGLDQV